MKRSFILICILALFAAGKVYAEPVNPEKALQVAARVFESRPATKAGTGTLSILWEGRQLEAAGTAAHTPAYYVITSSEGGFAIIAGDDNVRPVLAFSFENRFQITGMPEHVRKWMESLEVYVRTSDRQPADVARMWDAYTETKAPILTGLTDEYLGSRTVQWNQSGPANEACPIVPGESDHAVCGCLPLAVAEILVWFGYPAQGNGETPPAYSYYYNGNEVQIASHPLNTTYMWSELQQLDEPREFYDCTGEVRANLAQLVFDCGLLVQATYSQSGTGASEASVVGPFGTYMGYSKAAHVEYKNFYAQSDWDAMLKTQVLDHPVMYCGFSTSSAGMRDAGHAYVFDGYAKYNGADVFHVNMGWGGSCNGYYFSYSQKPNDYYDFNSGLCALLDFVPDPTGVTSFQKRLQLSNFGEEGISGVSVDREIKRGESFLATVHYLHNSGATTYNGKWGYKLEDKNGVVKESLFENDFTGVEPGWGYWWNYWITITEPIAFGDKIVVYYTTDEDNTVWERVSYPKDGTVVGELPVQPSAFIKKLASYSVGDLFEFVLFNNDYEYDATLWHVTTPSGDVVTYKQSEGGFMLTSRGTYKIVAEVRSSDSHEVKEWIATEINVE